MKTCSRVDKKEVQNYFLKPNLYQKNVWFIVYSYFKETFANFCRFGKFFSDKIMYLVMPGSWENDLLKWLTMNLELYIVRENATEETSKSSERDLYF